MTDPMMRSKHKKLLLTDGLVNLLLGVFLLLFPIGLIDTFGLPPANTYFYPSILGAVLFGIGLALILECVGNERRIHGLGLGGAIIINIVGSVVLICWLLFGSLHIPMRGRIILWIVGVLVFIIGIAEMLTSSWMYEK